MQRTIKLIDSTVPGQIHRSVPDNTLPAPIQALESALSFHQCLCHVV